MRILVLQHLDVEHPGVFRDFWAQAGHQWTPIEVDAGEGIPDIAGFDLLVAMGGPMDVWEEERHPWLVAEKAAIRRWVVDFGRPYLGVCLGHQLLAEAAGGKVSKMARPEVGLSEVNLTAAGAADPLMRNFSTSIQTFQWHGAEVSALPPGAQVLARNEHCEVQAFRVGKHAYGLQYHVEITETTVVDWENIPAYSASLEAALGAERARNLGSLVGPCLSGFQAAARLLNANLEAIVAAAR